MLSGSTENLIFAQVLKEKMMEVDVDVWEQNFYNAVRDHIVSILN